MHPSTIRDRQASGTAAQPVHHPYVHPEADAGVDAVQRPARPAVSSMDRVDTAPEGGVVAERQRAGQTAWQAIKKLQPPSTLDVTLLPPPSPSIACHILPVLSYRRDLGTEPASGHAEVIVEERVPATESDGAQSYGGHDAHGTASLTAPLCPPAKRAALLSSASP